MNAIPDPGQMIYAPAKRKQVGVLTMFSGPSGSGKTYSALRFARGLVGPDGVIAFCDTENDRALYYADAFTFHHYSLSEPFRSSKFEAAAIAAQQQKAVVWICDSFSHEHVGPGGLLDFHEEELQRLAGDNYEKRERMKAAAWIKPKGEHKHMLQRFWQMNVHLIFCCQAEKKLSLQPIKEGPKKGKIEFVDLGYQPICGSDLPYAMTMSFMLEVEQPGVPRVIKPLMPSLVPLIPLDRPIDEKTGEAIAAWATGGGKPSVESAALREETVKASQRVESPTPTRAAATSAPKPATKRGGDERDRIKQGAEELEGKFDRTANRREHLALVDDPEVRRQMAWLKKNAPELARRVDGALKASWKRTDPQRSQEQMPV